MKKTTKTSDPNDLSFLQKLFSSPFNSQTKHHSNYTDQQNLLSKLLNIQHQNAVSYDELAKRAENAGKISVVFVGAFYVIGLFVFSSYYSSLHIRSIELFRAKYLFIGFYFTLFSLLLIAQTL